jgi:hypothetical protein
MGLLSVLIGLLVLVALSGEASAIPAFARKYDTSCQTCHVPFPRLNPFGEAFRRNGYRFPAGEDEEATKEATIALGHEAHKKVFPQEVWPGSIPANIPLAAIMAGRVDLAPKPANETDPEVSFANLAGNFGLRLSTTFGETFSVWVGADVNAATANSAQITLDRAFLFIKPFADPVLNLRIGRFEPGLLGLSMHRMIGLAPWMTTTPVRDNSFALEPLQMGIEVTGVVGRGRLSYTAGVVEGGGDRINADKDAYARLSVKIGGMRLDGVGGAKDSLPWREKSLQIGAFGYFGRAALGDPKTASQEDTFTLVGGDLHLTLRDLGLTVAGSYGRNRNPSFATPNVAENVYHLLAHADYVVHPFIIPTLRYERRSSGDLVGDRLSAGLYGLIRANIRAHALVSIERDHEEAFALRRVVFGLNTVF